MEQSGLTGLCKAQQAPTEDCAVIKHYAKQTVEQWPIDTLLSKHSADFEVADKHLLPYVTGHTCYCHDMTAENFPAWQLQTRHTWVAFVRLQGYPASGCDGHEEVGGLTLAARFASV
eukprot:1156784-Pelagomonas_calceolata.AAC.6